MRDEIGCLGALLAGVVLAGCILLLPLLAGLNIAATRDGWAVTSTWDTVQIAREQQRTARARIEADADQERQQTVRIVLPVLAVVAGVTVVAIVWLRRPRQAQPPPPQQIIILAAPLLRQRAGRRLEVIDGDWCVVDDSERAIYQLEVTR